jgi:hypothetical protein
MVTGMVITVDGRLVLLGAQAAARAGMTRDAWRSARCPRDGEFADRVPWWYPDTVDAFMAGRAGQGARTDLAAKRPH